MSGENSMGHEITTGAGMTHQELFASLAAGKHIGHKWLYAVDIYLDENGMIVGGNPFDYDLCNLQVRNAEQPWYERQQLRVLCWVKHPTVSFPRIEIVTAHRDGCFVDTNGVHWQSAIPVKKSEVRFVEDLE